MKRAYILLAEDSPGLDLTLRALEEAERAGDTHVVRDGEEALDFIFGREGCTNQRPETPPGIVLLDSKLPKLSGIEVLKQLRQDSRTQQIPIVVFASSIEERDLLDSYNFGANSYIKKPEDLTEFTRVISRLCSYWLVDNQSFPQSGL